MEKEFIVRLLDIRQVTHNVKQFRMEKPEGYHFNPGQATDVCVNKPGWEKEKRPFTFTCLADDPFLQFTIKGYPDHHGVTEQLHELVVGDELILHEVWGAIEYKGPGVFIAGGAGITPFLAILRELYRSGKMAGNTLYFSNHTTADIIEEAELRKILGADAHFLLSNKGERIDKRFLQERIKDLKQPFYICGPDAMVKEISDTLGALGASPEGLVFEK